MNLSAYCPGSFIYSWQVTINAVRTGHIIINKNEIEED